MRKEGAPELTATDVGKHPNVIRGAQAELAELDVLVCGRCLAVFHFVEEFKLHKQKPCSRDNNLLADKADSQPKIWAFTLWKSTQLHNGKPKLSSWAMYQQWVRLEDSHRETWSVAGKTIMSFTKIAESGLTDLPVRITKTVVNCTNDKRNVLTPRGNAVKPLGAGALNKSKEGEDTDVPVTRKLATLARPHTPNAPDSGKRTLPDKTEKTRVEKILAKRFNPRRKYHEYLVKWENLTHDHNTWEPTKNLQNVQHALKEFEKQLQRQKDNRANAEQKAAAESVSTTSTPSGTEAAGKGRPSRTSKTRAMDQVKQWVSGNSTSPVHDSSDNREVSSTTSLASVKRKLVETDANDSKVSDSSSLLEDLEENLIPSHTVKRLRTDNGLSVEVKTNADQKSSASPKGVNGGLPGPAKVVTAEVMVTQDPSASGVVKKPTYNGGLLHNQKIEAQIRVLSKGEVATAGTGIRRVGAADSAIVSSDSPTAAAVTTTTTAATTLKNGTASPGSAATISTKPVAIGTRTVVHNRIPVQGRTAGLNSPASGTATPTRGTLATQRPAHNVIHRKGVPPPIRTTAQQNRAVAIAAGASPMPGRMIIPRTSLPSVGAAGRAAGAGVSAAAAGGTPKTVTPEQKILQLSKSGDLKVTKKVMTREDAVAQRQKVAQSPAQQTRAAAAAATPSGQSKPQVQIQKVQQIQAPLGRNISVTVRSSKGGQAEEVRDAQLCPITGKVINGGEQAAPIKAASPSPTAGLVHSQLVTEQQHHQLLQETTNQHVQQQQQQQQQQQLELVAAEQQQQAQQQQQEMDSTALLLAGDQPVITNEDGSPLLVTGEDGTVYQVAGKNADGQTILVTQGPDGEQQFAYVAAAEADESSQMLTLDSAVAEAVSQMPADQQAQALAAAAAAGGGSGEGQFLVKTTQEDGTTQMVTMTESELAHHQQVIAQQQQLAAAAAGQAQIAVAGGGGGNPANQLSIQTGAEGADGQETNIPAEVVQADLPSPGGTRRVVLLLQDGTYMVTEMHDDEFKALNIAA